MTENYEQTEERKSSLTPIILAAGLAVLFLGLVIFWPIAVAGLAIVAIAVFKLFKEGADEKFAELKESLEEKWPLEVVNKEKLGVWIFLMSEILIF